MSDLMEKIFEVFRDKYGQDAKMEDGETQVFVLKDCTVILSIDNGAMKVKVTADKPIECDFSSGLFIESEVEE